MSEVTGKIQWLPDAPTEYPVKSGDFNIGVKIKGAFYNLHDEYKKLESTLKRLKKGYEIKIDVENNKITNLEVISDKVEEETKPNRKPSLVEQLEKVNYKTLMNEAHRIGIVSTSVELVPELTNVEKKTACFKATVIINTDKGLQTFEDFGEACGLDTEQGGNIDSVQIRSAWIRMASTRALVRALRQATNNMETAEEELPDGKLPEGK